MEAGGPCNVVTLLRDAAQRVPDRLALVAPRGEAVTFAELWERVCRVSAGLREAGLNQGDRLVVMVPMSIELYALMLGTIKLGAVAVFVDPWISMRRIAQFAAFAEPSGFVGVGRSHLLRLLERRLRTLPVTVTTGSRLGCVPARRTLGELMRAAPDSSVWRPGSSEAPALITFTSGSSGVPKGANRTHGFLAAQYAALCREYHYEDTDRDMPMFPVFALRNLASGITSVIPDMDFRRVAEVDAGTILAQMETNDVCTCTASPPFIDRLAQAVAGGHGRPPRLRRILTGGAPVSDAALRRWRDAFTDTDITIVYGSTEAEPVAAIGLQERLEARGVGCCAGVPVCDVRARVIRIQRGAITFRSWDELVPADDGIGELVVSGAHVCRDYFRNPGAVAENKLIDDEGRLWHRMGDTGRFDDRGRFWLVGRVHSTITCKGAALHAQLLEAHISALVPQATRAAVLEVNDQLVVVIQGREEAGLLERLQAGGVPADRVVVTRRPLPLDPRHQSKIDYGELRRRLMGGIQDAVR